MEHQILNGDITISEIECAVKILRCNKAPWLDMIPAICVTKGRNVIAKHLQCIYSYMLEYGDFPGENNIRLIIL